jgi:hypothetical protein
VKNFQLNWEFKSDDILETREGKRPGEKCYQHNISKLEFWAHHAAPHSLSNPPDLLREGLVGVAGLEPAVSTPTPPVHGAASEVLNMRVHQLGERLNRHRRPCGPLYLIEELATFRRL